MAYCKHSLPYYRRKGLHIGKRKYLSDPSEDVRIATENQLAEFLREIKEVTLVQKHRLDEQRYRVTASPSQAPFQDREKDLAAENTSEQAKSTNGEIDGSELGPEADNGLNNDIDERDLGSKHKSPDVNLFSH
jgi:vacuole morphology and inheritance protein 14